MRKQSHTRIFGDKNNSHRLRNSLIVLAVLVTVLLIITGVRTYSVYESQLPSFEQLHNIEPSTNTKIYDRNGVLLKEFYSENRALTPLSEMPEHLRSMLIASEDQKFYDHWGIDLRRLVIIAASNLVAWEIRGGASTSRSSPRKSSAVIDTVTTRYESARTE